MSYKAALISIGGILLLGLLLFCGAEPLNFSQIFETSSPSNRIFFELRLPRLLFVILVGATLAILGGTYQVLFRNPLAEPYILGISSAVVLGVVTAEVIFGVPPRSFVAILSGFVGAVLGTALLMGIGLISKGRQVERIVLFGMGLNFVLSSSLFLVISFHHQQVGSGSLHWLFGHIPWLSLKQSLTLIIVSLPFLAALFFYGRHLDALSLGDGVSRTLGFSPVKTRNILLGLTSIFLAILVAHTGAIGFVGLVIPHMVRILFRPPTARWLFVQCTLFGAIFLGISDALARSVMPPFEFPIGIVTTLIGGPLFLILLWRKDKS